MNFTPLDVIFHKREIRCYWSTTYAVVGVCLHLFPRHRQCPIITSKCFSALLPDNFYKEFTRVILVGILPFANEFFLFRRLIYYIFLNKFIQDNTQKFVSPPEMLRLMVFAKHYISLRCGWFRKSVVLIETNISVGNKMILFDIMDY